jgi:hypothetical protein
MSLGGKKTQTTSIDPDLKAASLENLAMAKKVGQLGYVPYTGDTVAGMSPGQIAAIQSGNLGASAFGLPEMAVPTGANLNPYAAYEAALANIPAGQRAFIESMFINPQTGAAPTIAYGSAPAPAAAAPQVRSSGGGGRDYMPTGAGSGGNLSMLRANLPGGINTSNPGGRVNSVLGAIVNAISPQGSTRLRPQARSK